MNALRTFCLSMLCGGLLAQDARVPITPRQVPGRFAPGANESSANIRVTSDLVLVPVVVTDQSGRAITGLEKENFHLFDDRVEQEIRHFSSEDAPVSLALVFDTSASMAEKLDQARKAVSALLAGANPEDEFLLIEFNDNPRLLESFTQEADDIQAPLQFLGPHGNTALVDAACLALHEMKRARNARKAILIISDGGDNHSRYRAPELRGRVQEADVQIYSIGILAPGERTAALLEGSRWPGVVGRNGPLFGRQVLRGQQSERTFPNRSEDRGGSPQPVFTWIRTFRREPGRRPPPPYREAGSTCGRPETENHIPFRLPGARTVAGKISMRRPRSALPGKVRAGIATRF